MQDSFQPLLSSRSSAKCISCLLLLCCLDRKSTRLNSSHGYISYAVFCLKKKNIQVSARRGGHFIGAAAGHSPLQAVPHHLGLTAVPQSTSTEWTQHSRSCAEPPRPRYVA